MLPIAFATEPPPFQRKVRRPHKLDASPARTVFLAIIAVCAYTALLAPARPPIHRIHVPSGEDGRLGAAADIGSHHEREP